MLDGTEVPDLASLHMVHNATTSFDARFLAAVQSNKLVVVI